MKKRVVSAIFLIAICLVFYFLGGVYFVGFSAFLAVLGYKELTDLHKYPRLILILGLISLIYFIVVNATFSTFLQPASLVIPVILLLIPTLIPEFENKYKMSDAFHLLGGIYLLALSFTALNILFLKSKYFLLFLILMVTLNDTAAFMIGSKFGKTKISKISPKKSLEGLIAGIVTAILVGLIMYFILLKEQFTIIPALIIIVAIAIVTPIGDLLFSKIKRENDIKDFSNLIPGHGGILDRMDSLLFSGLVFYLIISII